MVLSTVRDGLFSDFVHAWSEVMVGRRLSNTVCDDVCVVFEDVLSKRMVLHRLLRPFLVISFVVSCRRGHRYCFSMFSEQGCSDLFVAFEDVWSEMGAPALGRVLEPLSVRI